MKLRLLRILPFAFLFLFPPGLSSAATWQVRQDGSGDFTTIGGAVAVAVAGDMIEVGPGTYPEQVDVYVRLTFVSTDGAAATILDGQGTHYTLWFRAGTDHVADGFTFTNGHHISGGGAIRCQAGATLTLRNSILSDNSSDHDGGAIFTRDTGSFIDVYDCEFRGNYAEHNGAAGIAILNSRINYTRCRFFNQTCGLQNAGVSCDHSWMDVRNCLFVGNLSESFAGIYYYLANGGVVDHNTLYDNYAGEWSAVLVQYSSINVTNNIIAGTRGGWGLAHLGGAGLHTCNLYDDNAKGAFNGALDRSERQGDPKFCDPANNNFTLSHNSKAAPKHSLCSDLIGAYPVGCGRGADIQRANVNALRNDLEQNSPNPFNPATQIRYTVASAGRVHLTVYDATGRVVRELVDEDQGAGSRTVTWDGRDNAGSTVASGVYFYRIDAGKFTETRRMVMLK